MRFMLAFGLGINLAILLAVFLPAYGAYHFFGVTPAMHAHIPHLVTGDGTAAAIDWLRLADPTGLLPENHGGLISFPSFHTTAAALFIYYCRSNRLLLGASCVLNALLLIATPLHGSHYLVDMVAGAFVALVVVAIVALVTQRAVPRLPARADVGLATPAWSGSSA